MEPYHFLLLFLTLLLLVLLIYPYNFFYREVWFDVYQPQRKSYVEPLGPFTKRIDYFDIYWDPQQTRKAGEYMIERTDYEVTGSPNRLSQIGKAIFIFPDGTITMDVSLQRNSLKDPAVLDPGEVISYPIVASTKAYLGMKGLVTFDVKSSLRRVVINGAKS